MTANDPRTQEELYELTHNMTDIIAECLEHDRNCRCPHCEGDPSEYEKQNVEYTTVIFSKTGYARGSGTDKYRWVAGLSADDKAAIVDGALVIVPRPFNDKDGWYYVVTCSGGRYNHRLPTKAEWLVIEQARPGNLDYSWSGGKARFTWNEEHNQ